MELVINPRPSVFRRQVFDDVAQLLTAAPSSAIVASRSLMADCQSAKSSESMVSRSHTRLAQLSHEVGRRVCVSFLAAHSFFNPRRIWKNGAFEARLFRRLGCRMLTLPATK
jgi:hypothetical protein